MNGDLGDSISVRKEWSIVVTHRVFYEMKIITKIC